LSGAALNEVATGIPWDDEGLFRRGLIVEIVIQRKH
jgi:hypothetical protein